MCKETKPPAIPKITKPRTYTAREENTLKTENGLLRKRFKFHVWLKNFLLQSVSTSWSARLQIRMDAKKIRDVLGTFLQNLPKQSLGLHLPSLKSLWDQLIKLVADRKHTEARNWQISGLFEEKSGTRKTKWAYCTPGGHNCRDRRAVNRKARLHASRAESRSLSTITRPLPSSSQTVIHVENGPFLYLR